MNHAEFAPTPANCQLKISLDNMKLRDLLHTRTQSQAWIEARVRMLLLGTLYHHAEAWLIASPLRRQCDPEAKAVIWRPRAQSRPNWRPSTPPVLRVCLLMCLNQPRMPLCSLDVPEDHARVQPPKAEWISIYCATCKPNLALGFHYVSPLGLLVRLVCVSCLHSQRGTSEALVPHRA